MVTEKKAEIEMTKVVRMGNKQCKSKHPLRVKRCKLDEGHSGSHLITVEGYSPYHAGSKCIKLRQDVVERWAWDKP